WVVIRESGNAPSSTPAENTPGSLSPDVGTSPDLSETVKLPKTPNVMGVELTGPGIIYLLDRGDGTRDTFDAIKGGEFKSIGTLGAGIKFQIIFWETDEIKEYPHDAMRFATPDSVATCIRYLGEVYAFKASRIEKSLEEAVAKKPNEIVIITGKSG